MKKQMRMAKNRMPPILSSIKAESEPFFIGSPSDGKWGLFRLRGRHHSFPFHSKKSIPILGCAAPFLKHILGMRYMRFIRKKDLLGIPSPFQKRRFRLHNILIYKTLLHFQPSHTICEGDQSIDHFYARNQNVVFHMLQMFFRFQCTRYVEN